MLKPEVESTSNQLFLLSISKFIIDLIISLTDHSTKGAKSQALCKAQSKIGISISPKVGVIISPRHRVHHTQFYSPLITPGTLLCRSYSYDALLGSIYNLLQLQFV